MTKELVSLIAKRALSLLMVLLVPWHATISTLDQLAGPNHFHLTPVPETTRAPSRTAHDHSHAAEHAHMSVERHTHELHDAGVVLVTDEGAIAGSGSGKQSRAPAFFDAITTPWTFLASRSPQARGPLQPHEILQSIAGRRLERPPRATQ